MKSTITIFLFFIAFQAFTQDPFWIKASWRQSQYPENVYLTGFVQDVKNDNESLSKSLERVKNLAIGNLAKKVVSNVKSESESYSQSTSDKNTEEVKETFETHTLAKTDIKINGIKVETFHDPKNNNIYAFAYANRYEVIGYYKASIDMLVHKIEGIIETTEQLILTGEKFKAKNEVKKALPLFDEIENTQSLLNAIDKNTDEESLQMNKSVKLKTSVLKTIAELENGIFIFTSIIEDVFGDSIGVLENKLKASLAKGGFSFTDQIEKADWILTIKAKARESSYYMDVYTSYFDTNVNLEKVFDKKNVYQNLITQKGNSMSSYKDAATKASETISSIIAKDLITIINK